MIATCSPSARTRASPSSPPPKLSPDWALTRLRLYEAENLPQAAFLWAKRLLPVLTEGGRSELLFRLTSLAFAQGDGMRLEIGNVREKFAEAPDSALVEGCARCAAVEPENF